MSQYLAGSGAITPIESYDQLVGYFQSACRPRDTWLIGTEYEKVAVRRSDGKAVPFTNGIEEVLRRMADRYDWQPIVEEGRIVALQGDGAAITLEPGGQFELSGKPYRSLHDTRREFEEHVRQIVPIGDELDIAFLGLGIQPYSTLPEIEWVPKKRYGIMGPYMLETGKLGQRMMKQTATVQMNMDYRSEDDAMTKLRVGMGITPILTAIFANSPITDGGLNGFRSFRAHIWTDTDPDRCGLLPFLLSELSDFGDYTNYALDVPMYFIVRDGRWINMTSLTFRRFWQEGFEGERATMDDWNAHLTTLFPEFRMKKYIEARAIDSQAPEHMLAAPAVIKGVFYNDDCLTGAWDLVKRWTWEERLDAYHQSHRGALEARVRGISLRDLALEILNIAKAGLERDPVRDDDGSTESHYLRPMFDFVKRGVCPADLLIDKWKSGWAHDRRSLIEATAYRLPE